MSEEEERARREEETRRRIARYPRHASFPPPPLASLNPSPPYIAARPHSSHLPLPHLGGPSASSSSPAYASSSRAGHSDPRTHARVYGSIDLIPPERRQGATRIHPAPPPGEAIPKRPRSSHSESTPPGSAGRPLFSPNQPGFWPSNPSPLRSGFGLSPPRQVSPPPPAARSSSSRQVQGFGVDYIRCSSARRPPPDSAARGIQRLLGDQNGPRAPPPMDAYRILTFEPPPEAIYSPEMAGTSTRVRDDNWRFELELVQEPRRGRALEREPLRGASPPLSPPLVAQLHVYDERNNLIPYNDPRLADRLVFLQASAELRLATDPQTSLGNVMFHDTADQIYRSTAAANTPRFPATYRALPFETETPPLISKGAHTVRGVSTMNGMARGGLGPPSMGRLEGSYEQVVGNFFIFPDLVVRPQGEFVLHLMLLDVSGPAGLGTSTGVTRVLTSVITRPFPVRIAWDGPLPRTGITQSFIDQGEKFLGSGGVRELGPRSGELRDIPDDGEEEESEDEARHGRSHGYG